LPLIEFTVNRKPVKVQVGVEPEAGVEAGATLLAVLRDKLGLMGAKNGCGKGHCGACTVVIDGEARRSCVVKAARLAGSEVTTIEGLAGEGGRLHPVQVAFIEAGAIQCGFCTPGMVMSVVALLSRRPDPTEAEVKEALRHNLCRCTGYASILRAVRLAAAWMRGETAGGGAAGARAAPADGGAAGAMAAPADGGAAGAGTAPPEPGRAIGQPALPEPGRAIGRPTPRAGAAARVTGRPIFAADLSFPDMVHGKFVLSEHPHAEVLAVDASVAQASPGVLAVLTAADVPGRNAFGLLVPHQPVLAGDRVRHLGDPVAVVLAETERQAEAAAAAVKATYRPLPAVFTPEAALADGAPRLHEEDDAAGQRPNIMHRVEVRKGDVAEAFRRADVIVEDVYTTPMVEHAYLEPEAAVAVPEPGGGVTVWTGSQGSHAFRQMIAASLALPEEKVRVIFTPTGGAFGGKEEPTVQIHCALGAVRLGRPVKMVLTREESIRISTKRHAERIHMRHGATRDGRLVAMEACIVADTGAYASLGKPVVFRSAVVAAGPYDIPNVSAVSVGVYTNNPVAGAFRGFGSTQVAFASEVQMDKLARRLELDPIEFRRRNALAEGKETITGQVLGPGTSYLETLEAVAGKVEELRAEARVAAARSGRRYGVGVASAYKNVGIGAGKRDAAGAVVGLTETGRLLVRVGSADIGQGSDTVMAQLAAEVTGFALDQVDVLSSDTALCPDGEETTASRQTYVTGNAVVEAARDFREKLAAFVAKTYGVPSDDIRIEGDAIAFGCGGGGANAPDGGGSVFPRRAPLAEVAARARAAGRSLEAESVYVAPTTYALRETADKAPGEDPSLWDVHFAYSFGTQAALVAVDEETGEVEVLKVVAAHDAGRVINPQGVRGQLEGGIVMGIGYALSEGLILENGRIVNDNLLKLRVPGVGLTPEMDPVIIEKLDPGGPFGAKGMGELAMNPTAPAIINAIRDAVGVYVNDLPADRGRVAAAIRRAAQGEG
jgi:CO/xanthine dehydrogenase Mo-binding subunit/aerobic-type carbon monoxide dehydrogenase small subunit (CoxS/CutS family)